MFANYGVFVLNTTVYNKTMIPCTSVTFAIHAIEQHNLLAHMECVHTSATCCLSTLMYNIQAHEFTDQLHTDGLV